MWRWGVLSEALDVHSLKEDPDGRASDEVTMGDAVRSRECRSCGKSTRKIRPSEKNIGYAEDSRSKPDKYSGPKTGGTGGCGAEARTTSFSDPRSEHPDLPLVGHAEIQAGSQRFG